MAKTARPQRSARWPQVHQIAGELKTLLAAYRFYGSGHHILQSMCNSLYQALSTDLATYEELSLDVSSLALSFEGRALFEAPNQKESLTHPLFLDGVQLIGFDSGVQPVELMELVRVWAGALESNDDALSSFVTDFWEGDFDFVRIFAMDSFHEGDQSDEARASLEQYDQLVARLSHESMIAVGGPRTNVVHIMREDASMLEQVGLRLNSEELKRRDRSNALAAYQLSADAAGAMLENLSCTDVEAVRRFLHAVMLSIQSLDEEPAARIQELVERVLLALSERGHFEVLAASVTLTTPTRGGIDPRQQVLENPAFIEPLLAALEDTESLPYVLQTLLAIPAGGVPLMLDRLVKMKPSEGREALTRVIHSKQPRVELLASRIGLGDGGLAVLFLEIADGYAEHDRRRLYKAALRHKDATVRHRVLQSIDQERYQVLRNELYGLLDDAERKVRREVLDMVMRYHDRSAVRSLAARMGSENVSAEEQRMVVAALGRLGGTSAGLALRTEFDARRDARMRAMILLALTRAEGESARPLLKKYSKKFLVNRQIKEAAIEGLRRLDAIAAGGGTESQPPPTAAAGKSSIYPSAQEPAAQPARGSAPDAAAQPLRAQPDGHITEPSLRSAQAPTQQSAPQVAVAEARYSSHPALRPPAMGSPPGGVPVELSQPPRHGTLPSLAASGGAQLPSEPPLQLDTQEGWAEPQPFDPLADQMRTRSAHNLRRAATADAPRGRAPTPPPGAAFEPVKHTTPLQRPVPEQPRRRMPSQPRSNHPSHPDLGRPRSSHPSHPDLGRPRSSHPSHPELGPPRSSHPSHPDLGRPRSSQPSHPDLGRPRSSQPSHPDLGRPRSSQPSHPDLGRPRSSHPSQPDIGRPRSSRPAPRSTGRPAQPAQAAPAQRPVRRPSTVSAARRPRRPSVVSTPIQSPSMVLGAQAVESITRDAQQAIDGDRVSEAIEILKRGLRSNSNAVDLYLLLADAQELDGHLDDAIQSLYQAVLLEPGRADVAERLWRLRSAKQREGSS